GSLTLFANYYSDPRLLFTVPPTAFHPPPKVWSSVIRLDLKQRKGAIPPVFTMIRALFRHRRKMLRASLALLYDKRVALHTLDKAQIEGTLRPEQLSFHEFEALFIALNCKSP
ncbi:MAG: ribosomal RNA small subunit methyltransferase A, partial [Simkaniaceae bacterium]|nr:ribosomal RNA small subunit methyltransferase A [Simkaniaceae bacterium]